MAKTTNGGDGEDKQDGGEPPLLDLNEETFAEQQRVHRLKMDHDGRLAELAQSDDIM